MGNCITTDAERKYKVEELTKGNRFIMKSGWCPLHLRIAEKSGQNGWYGEKSWNLRVANFAFINNSVNTIFAEPQ